MNPEDSRSFWGGNEGESAEATSLSAVDATLLSTVDAFRETDNMKRRKAKELIERYYYQLTDGCGNSHCGNEYCASSGKVKDLTPDEAAVQALELFKTKAQLCGSKPAKVAKTQSDIDLETVAASSVRNNKIGTEDTNFNLGSSTGQGSPNSSLGKAKTLDYLTEDRIQVIIDVCRQDCSYSLLKRTVGHIFSTHETLKKSFLRTRPHSNRKIANTAVNVSGLSKEDIRAMEGDLDKDQDSTKEQSGECEATLAPDEVSVDIESVRRSYKMLLEDVPGEEVERALGHALTTLFESLAVNLRLCNSYDQDTECINIFLIVMEIPSLGFSEYFDKAFPAFCRAVSYLPVTGQAKLARVWSSQCRDRLRGMIEVLQQLITVKVLSVEWSQNYTVNDDTVITSAAKVMKILYYSSLLSGRVEKSSEPEIEDDPNDELQDVFGAISRDKERKPQLVDPLAKELSVSTLDCRHPFISFEEFYNEALCEHIEMDKDFANYKSLSDQDSSKVESEVSKFSFMFYPFLLTTATKSLGLYYDNRIRMYHERRFSMLQSVFHNQPLNPYLKLKIRRDHIIDDALVELEVVAMENPLDLKKQLVVEFEGEQGIDEGGVSKEFFQLIVEMLFNPDYAMFSFNPETQLYWINPTSFENDAQFTLIGIILGLAIYNNIILDIQFPMVLYWKLMGKKGTFEDLHDFDPSLYRGFRELLDYDGNDVEEVFLQTFEISYTDVFGAVLTHKLKEDGDEIPVTSANRQEFIDLYADFLLNKSVERQFRAFRRGFQMVTDESPIKLLFRPEEVELLVCGSKDFDFNELEKSTSYDGGYTSSSEIIRMFWQVVHEMNLDDKRKLLQFTTGSDRIPVGGLSKLKLIIARNGPDTDRLPTAHTCFNVILLPEYSNKEKLKERLLMAIQYSKGFGML